MAARKAAARTGVEAHERAAGDRQRVGRAVQNAMSIGEIVSVGVVNLVRSTLVTALAGARDVGAELGTAATAAVRGSIRAAAEIGGDLGIVAKQAVKGTIQAAQEIGGDLGSVARSTTGRAVKTADELGGDVGKVARRAVEGAIEAGRDLGADVGSLARSAVEGAIEAADRISAAAGRTVRATLSTAVAGARSLVGRDQPPPENPWVGEAKAIGAKTGRGSNGRSQARPPSPSSSRRFEVAAARPGNVETTTSRVRPSGAASHLDLFPHGAC